MDAIVGIPETSDQPIILASPTQNSEAPFFLTAKRLEAASTF
jgi:hypothetical protein